MNVTPNEWGIKKGNMSIYIIDLKLLLAAGESIRARIDRFWLQTKSIPVYFINESNANQSRRIIMIINRQATQMRPY